MLRNTRENNKNYICIIQTICTIQNIRLEVDKNMQNTRYQDGCKQLTGFDISIRIFDDYIFRRKRIDFPPFAEQDFSKKIALKSRRENSPSWLAEHIINVPFHGYFAYFRNSTQEGSRLTHDSSPCVKNTTAFSATRAHRWPVKLNQINSSK